MKYIHKVLISICICLISFSVENGQSLSATELESFKENDIVFSIIDNDSVEVKEYIGNEKELAIPAEVNGYRVTAIGNEAFFYNDVIQNIILPETIEKIGNEAFAGSTLENINIPKSVQEVGYLAFQLTPIFEQKMENGVLYIDDICLGGEKDGFLEVVNQDEMMTIEIRPDTRVISDYAFIRNLYIEEVSIPESVEYIGKGAFYECDNLKRVDIASNVKVSVYAFDECDNLKVVAGDKAYLERCEGFKHTPFRTRIIAKKVGSIGSICVLLLAIVIIIFRKKIKSSGKKYMEKNKETFID